MALTDDLRHLARTKIVATVGPSCRESHMLTEMARAGAAVFRLNMAHAAPEEQQENVDNIRRVAEELGKPIGILVDLAGPKFRLGDIPGDRVLCETGAEFTFVEGQESSGPNEFTSSYAPLVRELSVGDTVMLADGTVSLEVFRKEPGRAHARVTQRGVVRSRQGINLPGVKLSAPAISVTDHQHAIWAAEAGVDFVSLSFVRAPDEMRALRDILRSHNSQACVIAKIEKREAIERLDDIVAESDAVMVARGDLGVEIDVAQMPVQQKRIIQTCHRHQRPVIIATQMLDSMHESLRPKRSEVTDVANAVLDGADACMLSGETAIGKYPRETVAMMNRICLATEASIAGQPPRAHGAEPKTNLHDITRAVVQGAGAMAHTLKAKLVVVASHSGRTALALSQHRHTTPTVGVSTSEQTLRRMCLYWGVMPLRHAPAEDMQQLIGYADSWACRAGFATRGDRIVIVGGSHLTAGTGSELRVRGVHDVIVVHEVECSD